MPVLMGTKPTKEQRDEAYRISFFADENLTQEMLADTKLLEAYIHRNKPELVRKDILRKQVKKRVPPALLLEGQRFERRYNNTYFWMPAMLLFVVYGFLIVQSQSEYRYIVISGIVLISTTISILITVVHIFQNKQKYFTEGIPNDEGVSATLLYVCFFMFLFSLFTIQVPIVSMFYRFSNIVEFNEVFKSSFLDRWGQFAMASHLVVSTLFPSLFLILVIQSIGRHTFINKEK